MVHQRGHLHRFNLTEVPGACGTRDGQGVLPPILTLLVVQPLPQFLEQQRKVLLVLISMNCPRSAAR